jgi:hypothetical protein
LRLSKSRLRIRRPCVTREQDIAIQPSDVLVAVRNLVNRKVEEAFFEPKDISSVHLEDVGAFREFERTFIKRTFDCD